MRYANLLTLFVTYIVSFSCYYHNSGERYLQWGYSHSNDITRIDYIGGIDIQKENLIKAAKIDWKNRVYVGYSPTYGNGAIHNRIVNNSYYEQPISIIDEHNPPRSNQAKVIWDKNTLTIIHYNYLSTEVFCRTNDGISYVRYSDNSLPQYGCLPIDNRKGNQYIYFTKTGDCSRLEFVGMDIHYSIEIEERQHLLKSKFRRLCALECNLSFVNECRVDHSESVIIHNKSMHKSKNYVAQVNQGNCNKACPFMYSLFERE